MVARTRFLNTDQQILIGLLIGYLVGALTYFRSSHISPSSILNVLILYGFVLSIACFANPQIRTITKIVTLGILSITILTAIVLSTIPIGILF